MAFGSPLTMQHFPRLRAASTLAAVIAASLLLGACGKSGYVYIADSSGRTYFRVPQGWTKYTKQQMLQASNLDESQSSDEGFRFLVGFDSDPKPSLDHVVDRVAQDDYPIVYAHVRELSAQARDQLSLQTIRNMVYPVDQLLNQDAADLLDIKDIVLDGGIHGARTDYQIALQGNFDVSSSNQIIRVAQIGLVDPATRLSYLFYVRCTAECFKRHRTQIDQVVESFTVKEP